VLGPSAALVYVHTSYYNKKKLFNIPVPSRSYDYKLFLPKESLVSDKEDVKEQLTPRHLSATTTRVLQCTCPVAASRKYFSAIHTSPPLTSTYFTPDYVKNIILHLLWVLCTAVNVRNKN
jgi:hypothetical protein